VIAVNDSLVQYRKKMILKNYVKTRFELEVNRRIRLIGKNEAVRHLNLQEIKGLKYVGFESKNEVLNSGKQSWKKDTGLLSIWILGMFPGGATVVIPYREGPEKVLGKIYSEYFGEQLESLTDEDVIVGEGKLFYNGSGDRIGKIGIGPKRAKSLLGSYDSKNQILTIVQFTFSEDAIDYVNSQWDQQKEALCRRCDQLL
jgi:hypothetical protein